MSDLTPPGDGPLDTGDGPAADGVEALLAPLVELPDERLDDALQALCVEHPELADQLRERYALWRELLHPSAKRPPAAETAAPRFGDYELIEPLGSGGMGVVWLARQRKGGVERSVALKMIRDRALFSAESRERFRREAQAALRVDHPGLCPIYDVGEYDGTPYLAMRRVPGRSLAELLDEARRTDQPLALPEPSHLGDSAVSPASAGSRSGSSRSPSSPSGSAPGRSGGSRRRVDGLLRFIEQAARALHAAHEAGLLHRDVKPGNLMVTPSGDPVVLDFGLVRDLDAPGSVDLTVSGQALGTPSYMAPEQIEPRGRTLDRATDVYALGATLFECLTLRPPFSAETRDALYHKILQEPAPPLGRVTRGLPGDLAVVIETALRKESGRRYATALEFAEDLRRIRKLQPIHARPTTAMVRTGLWMRRNPLVSVALVLLAITTGMLAWQVRETTLEAERTRDARDLAQQQSILAGRAREEAERSLIDARDAINALMWTARTRLIDLPGSQLIREDLLETALKFHDRLVARHADDPRMTFEAARSAIGRGQLLLDLGRTDATRQAIDDGLRLLDEARANGIPAGLVDQERASALSSLARLLTSTGVTREALDVNEECIASWQRAIAANRAPYLGLRVALASDLRTRASLLRELGRPTEAITLIEQAVATLEGLTDANGHSRHQRVDGVRADCWTELGRILRDRGDGDAAGHAFEEAVAAYRRLVARPDATRSDRNGLASELIAHARLLATTAHEPLAAANYREAIAVLEGLLRDFPGSSTYARNLGTAWSNLYGVLRKLGRTEAAREALQRAVDLYAEQLARGDTDDETRLTLALLSYNLGNANRQSTGNHVSLAHYLRAADTLQPLLQREVASLDSCRLAARALQNAAICQALDGEMAAADELFQRALEVTLDTARRYPEDLPSQASIGLLQHNLAVRAFERNDLELARDLLAAALERRERLLLQSPEQTARFGDLLTTTALALRGDDAAPWLDHARRLLELCQTTVAERTVNGTLRSARRRAELARVLDAVARAERDAGDRQSATARWQRAADLLQPALAIDVVRAPTWVAAATVRTAQLEGTVRPAGARDPQVPDPPVADPLATAGLAQALVALTNPGLDGFDPVTRSDFSRLLPRIEALAVADVVTDPVTLDALTTLATMLR